MTLKIFLMVAALFCGGLAGMTYSDGNYPVAAIMAVCAAINLINFASAEY